MTTKIYIWLTCTSIALKALSTCALESLSYTVCKLWAWGLVYYLDFAVLTFGKLCTMLDYFRLSVLQRKIYNSRNILREFSCSVPVLIWKCLPRKKLAGFTLFILIEKSQVDALNHTSAVHFLRLKWLS